MIDTNSLIILSVISFIFLAMIIAITLIIILLGKGVFGGTYKGMPKSFGLFFVRSNFQRIIAIILILYALLVVVIIGDKGNNDKVITVLSSIAAFVLGGLSISQPDEESSSKNLNINEERNLKS